MIIISSLRGLRTEGLQAKCQPELLCETMFKNWNTKIKKKKRGKCSRNSDINISHSTLCRTHIYCICSFSWMSLREADSHSHLLLSIYLLRIMPKLKGSNKIIKVRIWMLLFHPQLLAPSLMLLLRKECSQSPPSDEYIFLLPVK